MCPAVPSNVVPADEVVVRFGVFEADLRSGELRKKGVKVKIQELPFRALKLLLSRPNEVVNRDELRGALWPNGVYVDFDRGITSAINRLRDALGDSAENPVFVETVGRRGYRWIAPTSVAEVATLVGPPKVIAFPLAKKARRNMQIIAAVAVFLVVITGWFFRSSLSRIAGRPQPIASSSSSPSASTGFTHRPANHEAEELYLQGRFYWNKRTPESLTKAVDFFTQAIVHDPSYAKAYVGMADCYNLLREFSVMPATEAYPRALAAAKKAVELDDQASQAHASLGFVSFYGMWDAATADREFRRAIELDPNNAVAHHWYATYLMSLRRYSEALAEIERAQALDPTAASVVSDKATILFNAGRRDEAVALFKQVEENEPNFLSPHHSLKFIYLGEGNYPAYLEEAKHEATLTHDDTALAMTEAAHRAFAAGGGPAMVAVLRREQKKLFDAGKLSPYLLAYTSSAMGDKREALHYLEVAYQNRIDGVAQIEGDAVFNPLHNEPAFRDLIAKIGLPPVTN